MMRKLFLLFPMIWFLADLCYGQLKSGLTGNISGVIMNEQNQTLPGATVRLVTAKDSALVRSAVSQEDGKFMFSNIAEGRYLIIVDYVGYLRYRSAPIDITATNSAINLSHIPLATAGKSLQTVTITAQKPLIEMQADKLVMNVRNTISATGNTALEVLQKAPGVVVNQNDEISVNGKSGILIYMDGKQTYMSQTDLITLLENMRSDQIDKLEIISNPSAKYDAAGKAIINIVTIRNKDAGTNGNVTIGAGAGIWPTIPVSQTNGLINYKNQGITPRYNTGLSLNNRKGKVNLFGNFYYNQNKGFSNSQTYRIVTGTRYDQYAYSTDFSRNLNYKTGLDYFLNKKTTIGFLASGNIGHWENPDERSNNGYFKNPDGSLQSSPLTTSRGFNSWANTTLNANLRHSFDSLGRELTVDFDYSYYHSRSGEYGLNTHFYNSSGQEYGTPLNITSNIPNVYHIAAGRADYTIPMNASKAKLDLGVKSSWVQSDNDFRFFTDGAIDPGRTNHFIYKENIDAAYSNFNKAFGPVWSLQVGLRMEYTHAEGNSLTLVQGSTRSYLNFFPSIFVKQTINKDNEIAYSYSRRINRPAYNTLNPFVYFVDPYTYEVGNERLKPAYTDSYGINYTFKHAFVATLGYSNTNNFMAQLYKNAIDNPEVYDRVIASTAGTNVDPSKITYLTTDNLAQFQVANLGLTAPLTVTNWWNMYNNFTLLYINYHGQVSNSLLDYHVIPYNFYTSQTFKLPKSVTLETSLVYNSRTIYGQIKARQQYSINLGIRKSLWNSRANLSLSANDIFATNRFVGKVNTTGVIYESRNYSTSRSASINFNYKFGNSNIKSARNRSTATEDERNRIKL